MTREEFISYYDMTPERAKKTLELVTELVNEEVRRAIVSHDLYENPTSYLDETELKEKYGEDALEREGDCYPNLYDYSVANSSVSTFMNLISCNTFHGGQTCAVEACRLMGIEW